MTGKKLIAIITLFLVSYTVWPQDTDQKDYASASRINWQI